jgi:trk system potassium uptake protein TrkA
MKVVIDGAGEVGSHLAKLLSREGNEVTVMDNDEKRLEAISNTADVGAVEGEPSSIAAMRRAGVDEADLFIAVFPHVNQEVNLIACMFAKKLGAKKVVARIHNDLLGAEPKKMIRETGIDMTFCPEKIASDVIVSHIKRGLNSDTLDFVGGKLQLAVFRMGEESPILDTKLIDFVQEFSVEEASQFRVIAITRDEKTIIPRFDTKFKYGDIVYIMIKKAGLKKLTSYLGVSDIDVDKVMIVGGGTVGTMTAASLFGDVEDIKVIEVNHNRCVEVDEILDDSILVVNGDGRNPDFLVEEGIMSYDAFVAVTGNDEANILACVAAKKFGVPRTIAEVENIEYVSLAEEMGIDLVVNKKLSSASLIFKMTLSDKAKFIRYMSGTKAEVLEYTAAKDSAITRSKLRDIDFPEGAVVGGILRDQEAFIAVGDTVIQDGDRVVVFALPSAIKAVDKMFK